MDCKRLHQLSVLMATKMERENGEKCLCPYIKRQLGLKTLLLKHVKHFHITDILSTRSHGVQILYGCTFSLGVNGSYTSISAFTFGSTSVF